MDEAKNTLSSPETPQAQPSPAPQEAAPDKAAEAPAKEPKKEKAAEPEYYTLLAKPPKKKDKADVEAAKKIANRYLGIQALEKIVNAKKARKKQRELELKFKAPETPEEFYERGQQYINGSECAVPFQDRAMYAQKAADMFAQAGDYLDAPTLAVTYSNIARESEEDGYRQAYSAAMERKRRAQTEDDWFEAARAFERIPGYQDADAQAAECQQVLEHRANLQKPLLLAKVLLVVVLIAGGILYSRTDRFHYQFARLAHRMGIDSVAAAFLSSDSDYGDTANLLEEIYYTEGVERMEKGNYKGALTALRKCTAYHEDLQERLDACNYALGEENLKAGHHKIAKDHFKECSIGYKNREAYIDECNYHQALYSLEQADIPEALSHFFSANGFADTAQLRYEPELTQLREALVGEHVYFGAGEYLLLERQGDTLTLLATVFDPELTYHRRREAVDWAHCSLRAALNGPDYLNAQFSAEEQALLRVVDGESDLVAIPSQADFLRWQELAGQKKGIWWLRDNGEAPDQAMFVSSGGEVMAAGYPVNAPEIGVRPLIRVELPEEG